VRRQVVWDRSCPQAVTGDEWLVLGLTTSWRHEQHSDRDCRWGDGVAGSLCRYGGGA
jgi:hypothetical protein